MSLGSLAIPAAALADGAIDPNFHGTGYHFGTTADLTTPTDGIVLAGSVTRLGTVVQADGRIVVGGQSSDGFMTLVRYNLDGSLDHSFNNGTGIVKQQFSGTPAGLPGTSGASALTQDSAGNIYVAGFGGSQSEFAARFTASGVYTSSAVCYAPHLIDYTARALAVRPNGTVVIVGYARDRHAAILDPSGLTQPTIYGQRAALTLPVSGNSTTACGAYVDEQGSTGVTADGISHAGVVSDATLSGRWYEGVASLANNSYVVVSTNGTTVGNDTGAWVQRFTAAGALDATFNAAGAVHGRVSIAGANLHAVTIAPGDGTVYAVGESGGSMLLARITTAGVLATLSPYTVASGGNTGQAVALQADGKVIVAGGATGGGNAFALALA
ncbi:MAG TPA: delta-60 repeat domain-containing protein, partial [Gaiellales bacterium]